MRDDGQDNNAGVDQSQLIRDEKSGAAMTDIFISYAKEDKNKARRFAEILQEYGWTVWWDLLIPPGSTFDEVIREAISTARCVIVLWSAKSIDSDWVKEEAEEARRRKILVPILIDDIDLPFGFTRIEAARLFNWRGDRSFPEFEQLLQSIEQITGVRRTSSPKPSITQKPDVNKAFDKKERTRTTPAISTRPSYLIAFFLHGLFGAGMFYAKRDSWRKWIYPFAVAAILFGLVLVVLDYDYNELGYDIIGDSAAYSVMLVGIVLYLAGFLDTLLACRSQRRQVTPF